MSGTYNLRGVHRFAIATTSATVLLLMAGALVTSNDAADSVPDWPLAYGRIIPPLVGGTRLLRKLGMAAMLLIIAQALLGAARVLFQHPAVTATIHATLAQIFFVT